MSDIIHIAFIIPTSAKPGELAKVDCYVLNDILKF